MTKLEGQAFVKPATNKLRSIGTSPELVLELLKMFGDGIIIGDRKIQCMENPIPPDATVVSGAMDESTGVITLVIESESFTEIPEGSTPPIFVPTFEWTAVNEN